MKFKATNEIYFLLIPGNTFVEVFNGKGEKIGENSLESIRDTLLNYYTMIRVFPWEE